MHRAQLSAVAFTLTLLLSVLNPVARADGVCTPRDPTAVEKKSYADAYALFLRAAPRAPDGWTSTDHPATGTMPKLCREYGNPPVRRHFDRDFHLERGRQEREDEAVQAYTTQMENQQARAAANQAGIEAIDVKINALITKTQAAAAAQKFAEIEALNHQTETLMKQKASLMGFEEGSAREASIEAEATRDTEATFSLWFEAPTSEPRSGKPYRTAAGTALLTAYDDKGNPTHDVRVFFNGAPQQARVMVVGDPARVRGLLDATDLRTIAAFKDQGPSFESSAAGARASR
jgi:hypothetical protein